jgi:hypothetical protein
MQLLALLHFGSSVIDFGILGSVLVPIAAIILGGVITVSSMYFKHQRERQWHETARIALEKGQPLPPYGDERPDDSDRVIRRKESDARDSSQNDVRGGLVLVGVGVGIWLMLSSLAPQLRAVGAIPGLIGVALLLYAAGRAFFARNSSDSDRRPPQS